MKLGLMTWVRSNSLRPRCWGLLTQAGSTAAGPAGAGALARAGGVFCVTEGLSVGDRWMDPASVLCVSAGQVATVFGSWHVPVRPASQYCVWVTWSVSKVWWALDWVFRFLVTP